MKAENDNVWRVKVRWLFFNQLQGNIDSRLLDSTSEVTLFPGFVYVFFTFSLRFLRVSLDVLVTSPGKVFSTFSERVQAAAENPEKKTHSSFSFFFSSTKFIIQI